MKKSFLILTLFLCGCGYQSSLQEMDRTTISIPYIQGDETGELTNALIDQLATSGRFDYRSSDAPFSLRVQVLSDGSEHIDYRYDRGPDSGVLHKNIVGAENRRTVIALVTLVDQHTDKVLWGPQKVKGSADYDYVDPHALQDLTFVGSNGVAHTVIDFSLGQLDSEGGANIDAAPVAYRHLSKQIVDALIAYTLSEKQNSPSE